MGKTHLDLALLLTLLIQLLPFAHAAQQLSSARLSLPLALQDRLSPLSRQQEIYYGKLMKRGGAEAMSESILYEFCKSARLLCGTSLQESTWGSTIAAETTSPAFESSIAFHGWLPSTSDTGMGGEVETASLALDKRGRSPKAKQPLPSASKTGVGMDEPAALFRPWGASRMGETATEPKGLQEQFTAKYFREKDLMVGAQLVPPSFLYQPTSDNDEANAEWKPSFLPASIALYLPPFDTHHLNDLLQLFHIPFDTHMAQKMEEVLKACEAQGLGKDNNFITSFCATSIEGMLKFASSMLSAPNNKIQAMTNSKIVGRVGGQVTILRTAELAAGCDAVDCHELMFPFKVMGCHQIKESKAMVVRVADEEGVDMDLLVACHKDTTLFDPRHEAFAELRSSPGHTEICHFLPNTDIMWIPL